MLLSGGFCEFISSERHTEITWVGGGGFKGKKHSKEFRQLVNCTCS